MSKLGNLVKKGMGIDTHPMTAGEYDKIRNEYGEDLNVEEAKLFLDEIRNRTKSPEQIKEDEKKEIRRMVGLAIGATILYESGKMLMEYYRESIRRFYPDDF